MRRALRFTEEEGRGIIFDGLWRADSGGNNLFLVGRLLSQRAHNFDGLCSSIKSIVQPVRGMEFKQLLGERLLMRFFHTLDRQQTLEGCLWIFEKNILIMNTVGADENSMNVNLNWCDFYVHIHELPLNWMNLGIAIHIGNKLGVFRDMEMDDTGHAWRISLHIMAEINVNKPLKRAFKIRTSIGDKPLVHFTYERLPNFCNLCGRLGHIATYCEERFSDGFVDPISDLSYGPWLRVPLPTRGRPPNSTPSQADVRQQSNDLQ
ncbi:hypothetical protein Salat_2693200 [Sesamum alatum]|uniref:Zinc knuckle CX2CX4HX4C domain-containing protein n=1 Tax=Sesamum alatum TaxID=300844 RepID=A0AAE1XQV3_9LAMI|nr:hypothetical protein Salat_2693200 [Sesamum alatum]